MLRLNHITLTEWSDIGVNNYRIIIIIQSFEELSYILQTGASRIFAFSYSYKLLYVIQVVKKFLISNFLAQSFWSVYVYSFRKRLITVLLEVAIKAMNPRIKFLLSMFNLRNL